MLKTFVIQFPISAEIRENRNNMLALLAGIPAHSLVLFPEGALSGYSEDASFVNAIDIDVLEASLEKLREAAIAARIHLCFGSCLREEGHWYNAAIYFGPAGERFIYRKINLAISERRIFSAGDELSCFDILHQGNSIRLAFQLCREIRFPEQWQALARQGAQLFLYPTNAVGDAVQADVWRSHLVSRAAENQRFVLSANVAAPAQKCPSMIVDPKGYVRWQVLSEETQIGVCDIDLSESSSWYLDQSRRDVVAG